MKGVHAYANQGPLENLTTQFLFSEMATYSFTETEHKNIKRLTNAKNLIYFLT